MARVLIWDLPVRLFHWLLTAALLGAFTVALTVDDDSATFALHYLAGSVAGFLVLLRIVWGVVGSRWARFRDFTFGPGALAGYLRAALFGGDGARYVGHNPATSWAVVAMFVLILSIVTTGLLMGSSGEVFEEIHEILAWTLAAVVGAHVAGVALHTFRHRENIAASMVTGQREADAAQAIPSTRPLVGVALLAAVGAFAFGVSRGYDAAAGTVTCRWSAPSPWAKGVRATRAAITTARPTRAATATARPTKATTTTTTPTSTDRGGRHAHPAHRGRAPHRWLRGARSG